MFPRLCKQFHFRCILHTSSYLTAGLFKQLASLWPCYCLQSKLFYCDLVITNTFPKGSQIDSQHILRCVCVHVDTNVKCPQFSNVYQKHCYLCLRWILRSIQFPVDYWHKMWSRALTHMGSEPFLSHAVADRQKGHSRWSSLWKKRATDNFLSLPFPIPLWHVPQEQTEPGRGQ